MDLDNKISAYPLTCHLYLDVNQTLNTFNKKMWPRIGYHSFTVAGYPHFSTFQQIVANWM